VHDVGLPLHEAVAMATTSPARAVALRPKEELKIGCDADFVIISPDLEVLQTFSGGERIFKSGAAM
jgi:N-acetylglucosamine-6-phosphate deacetylase